MLHNRAHACRKYGSSNTNTISFTAAQAIAHNVEPVSHAFLTSTVVAFRELVNTLKVRTGTFYSQKRAWWYGRATSDQCVLCGQPDGTLHAVRGCPALSLAVTKRHNEAVTLVSKATLTGECGAQVVSMDVSAAEQQNEGIQETSQSIPHVDLASHEDADWAPQPGCIMLLSQYAGTAATLIMRVRH